MSAYYSPDGRPCTCQEWVAAFKDPAQKIVKKDTVCDGLYDVSTVYLGLDHGWGDRDGARTYAVALATCAACLDTPVASIGPPS